MRLLRSLLPLLALCLAVPLVLPGLGFTLAGGSLDLTQRDFRIFNNFSDLSANDNVVPDPSFPGHQGAVMAIWKASVEWSSGLHGDGSGDPHQPGDLGSGGANFDVTFQSEALDPGDVNGNVHSELTGGSGGIYAFTETPISDGWRIRYYSFWNWEDGPGPPAAGIDLQAVATHEYGHALGLGHSSVPGATMGATFVGSGVEMRSIEADDSAGIQAIYGTAGAGKVRILGATLVGQTVTVSGVNFAPTGNDLWFTQAAPGGTGDPVVVSNLASSGGGTSLVATLPAGAGPGDILVRRPGSSGADLSNPWPLNTVATPPPPTLTGVLPSSVPALVLDGAASLTLAGSGFLGLTALRVDGQTLPASKYQVFSDTLVTLAMPKVSKLGPVSVEVITAGGLSQGTVTVTEVAPTVDLVNSSPGFLIQSQGLGVAVAGAPGDAVFLCVSSINQPTILPGLIDLAIGGGLANVVVLNLFIVPPKGWLEVTYQTGGVLPSGLNLYVQGGAFLASSQYAAPGVGTNVQTGVVLF